MNPEISQQEDRYDFLVFVGRFQPFHNGHQAVVRTALERARFLIMLVGSAHRARCTRNPWTFAEREAMIRATLSDDDNRRVFILPVMDATYNDDLWLSTVQKCVAGVVAAHHDRPHRAPEIGLIGHAKDHTSYYLQLFPQWGAIDVAAGGQTSGTDVRQRVFKSDAGGWEDQRLDVASEVGAMVPAPVLEQLEAFVRTDDFQTLREEHDFVVKYRAQWSDAPYDPMFVTVDAVVVQSGHVLLVERGARPGKGRWALPGGFVDGTETIRTAVLRELKEETRIRVPLPVLAGSIVGEGVFDDPHRSARGRTITHAFLIHLKPDTSLPKVRGSDDARHAFWVPLAELQPDLFFEDHYFIVQRMIGKLA
ncbi:MAG: bifunctional nicotinamide-nucleotide adenylyltransferase/Nudix hydroxylase [Gammaproteobacteria bacterium]